MHLPTTTATATLLFTLVALLTPAAALPVPSPLTCAQSLLSLSNPVSTSASLTTIRAYCDRHDSRSSNPRPLHRKRSLVISGSTDGHSTSPWDSPSPNSIAPASPQHDQRNLATNLRTWLSASTDSWAAYRRTHAPPPFITAHAHHSSPHSHSTSLHDYTASASSSWQRHRHILLLTLTSLQSHLALAAAIAVSVVILVLVAAERCFRCEFVVRRVADKEEKKEWREGMKEKEGEWEKSMGWSKGRRPGVVSRRFWWSRA